MMYRALLVILIQFESPYRLVLVHGGRLFENERGHFIHLLLVLLVAGVVWR